MLGKNEEEVIDKLLMGNGKVYCEVRDSIETEPAKVYIRGVVNEDGTHLFIDTDGKKWPMARVIREE